MDSDSATSRRKVTDGLNHWETLAAALRDEDELLRGRLASCPRDLREARGSDDSLSFKETLGHIAFWDNFTVEFFKAKLDKGSCTPAPPVDFEIRSREALEQVADLPFGEVLARYLEANGALLDFLGTSWSRLSDREKHDFWVPLKHRRHHRIALFRALDRMEQEAAQGERADALAAEA